MSYVIDAFDERHILYVLILYADDLRILTLQRMSYVKDAYDERHTSYVLICPTLYVTSHTGWRRPTQCLVCKVIFRERAL